MADANDPHSTTVEVSRDAAIYMLGSLMSELSETCYAAGWHMDMQEIVPAKCREVLRTGKASPWGMSELSLADAKRMNELAVGLGHWVTFNPNGDEPEYVPYYPKPGD
jgi:hypothetical protein